MPLTEVATEPRYHPRKLLWARYTPTSLQLFHEDGDWCFYCDRTYRDYYAEITRANFLDEKHNGADSQITACFDDKRAKVIRDWSLAMFPSHRTDVFSESETETDVLDDNGWRRLAAVSNKKRKLAASSSGQKHG